MQRFICWYSGLFRTYQSFKMHSLAEQVSTQKFGNHHAYCPDSKFVGQHGAHLGPLGLRWAPCCPMNLAISVEFQHISPETEILPIWRNFVTGFQNGNFRCCHWLTFYQHRSGSSLVQAMAWCLTVPSHLLHQCWFLIKEVAWYSQESDSIASATATNLYNDFESVLLNLQPCLPGPMNYNDDNSF